MWPSNYWSSSYWSSSYWVTVNGGPTPPTPIGPVVDGLLHSPSDVIRHLLANLGVGSLPSDNTDWPIYESMENDTPDNVMTVYSTSGILHGRIQITGRYIEEFGIQVRFRANGTVDAYRKASEVLVKFDNVILENTVTIDSVHYIVLSVNRKGGILSLGRETPQSKRSIYTLNAVASIQRHSS